MPAPVLGFIDADEAPHKTTDQNDRFGFAHMDLFFKYDQGIGKTKTDQGYITDPSNCKTVHSFGPMEKGEKLAQAEYLQSPWPQDELNNLIYLKI